MSEKKSRHDHICTMRTFTLDKRFSASWTMYYLEISAKMRLFGRATPQIELRNFSIFNFPNFNWLRLYGTFSTVLMVLKIAPLTLHTRYWLGDGNGVEAYQTVIRNFAWGKNLGLSRCLWIVLFRFRINWNFHMTFTEVKKMKFSTTSFFIFCRKLVLDCLLKSSFRFEFKKKESFVGFHLVRFQEKSHDLRQTKSFISIWSHIFVSNSLREVSSLVFHRLEHFSIWFCSCCVSAYFALQSCQKSRKLCLSQYCVACSLLAPYRQMHFCWEKAFHLQTSSFQQQRFFPEKAWKMKVAPPRNPFRSRFFKRNSIFCVDSGKKISFFHPTL